MGNVYEPAAKDVMTPDVRAKFDRLAVENNIRRDERRLIRERLKGIEDYLDGV